MIEKNKKINELKDKFIDLIKYRYNIEKTSRKLDIFYNLSFKDFVTEIKSEGMSIEKESELMNFFEDNSKEILKILEIINKIDIDLDNLVYELYGITDKEKEVIENSLTQSS